MSDSNLRSPSTRSTVTRDHRDDPFLLQSLHGAEAEKTGYKRNAPEIEETKSKRSTWSLLAAWDAQENTEPSMPDALPHIENHSNKSLMLSPTKSVQSTSIASDGGRTSDSKSVRSLPSSRNYQSENQHDALLRQAIMQHIKAPPSTTASDIESSHNDLDEHHARKRASPGALLRLQSATTSPAPHPLPDLMRLTSHRHLIPMSRIIHSMASLSRAGRENSQRKANQDSCFAFRQYIQPYQAIAGVLDGHGPNGTAVSSFIKQQIPVAVSEQLRRRGEVAAGAALRAAFLDTQSALHARSSSINARLSGSTAVVSLLQGKRITTAWVGDSKAMLVRRELANGGWRGIALTQDHKPTSASELSRILAAGGRVERLSDAFGREVGPQRVWLPGAWVPGLAMSRALGDFVAHSVGVIAEPEIHSCDLEERDEYLVVASDGVWEFVTVQEAAEVVGGCKSAEDACRVLVDFAAEKWRMVNEGVTDDISVVVAKFFIDEKK